MNDRAEGTANWLTISSLLLAGVLAALGLAFVLSPDAAFSISGHAETQMATIMGGRYAGLALAIAALTWLKEFRALAAIFAVGVFLGLFDLAVYAGSGTGDPLSHLLAALAAGSLCVWAWRLGNEKKHNGEVLR